MKESFSDLKKIFQEKVPVGSVNVRGWVRSIRKKKNFSFMIINDGSTQDNLQIVIDTSISNYDDLTSVLTGSSVAISGELVLSQGQGQKYEIVARSGYIIGKSDENYPLQKKATSLEFLRDNAHFRARTNLFGAVFRIRNVLSFATHEFFQNNGFYYANTPIITGIDAEGAGEMFGVTGLDLNDLPKLENGKIDFEKDYFSKETSLAVTGQLEAESLALGLGKVYTFGPTFRSENSNTSRHLSEFWMIEPEVAFADLEDVAKLAVDYIKYLIYCVLE